MKRWCALSLVVLGCSAWVPAARPQSFPNKPIRLITGNPPGTVIDGNVRMVSPELEKLLGQPVLIEHRTGANSTIAAQAVKNAAPDGYTLLLGSGPQASILLNANNGVDVGREMVAVSMLVKAPYVLFARANQPFTTMAELIAYSKANPDKLKFGAASQVQELVMAVIKSYTGITSISIPYRGSPPIVAALLGERWTSRRRRRRRSSRTCSRAACAPSWWPPTSACRCWRRHRPGMRWGYRRTSACMSACGRRQAPPTTSCAGFPRRSRLRSRRLRLPSSCARISAPSPSARARKSWRACSRPT